MTSGFEVRVSGRLPRTVSEAVSARWGELSTRNRSHSTVLTGTVVDQAALRALLDLIWDTGGSVLSVTLHPAPSPEPHRQR